MRPEAASWQSSALCFFFFDLFCFTFRQQGIQRNEQVTPGGVGEGVCSSGRRPEVRNTLSGCIKEMIIYEL